LSHPSFSAIVRTKRTRAPTRWAGRTRAAARARRVTSARRGLIGALGAPAAKVATRKPGQILHRDAWQIVAKPAPGTPVAWH